MLDGSLGRRVEAPREYAPKVLTSISRTHHREKIGFDSRELNCVGLDIWECYELTWLNEIFRPQIAELRITIPASSSLTFESKSMKLYLGSFAYTQFEEPKQLQAIIQNDLETRLECNIGLEFLDRFTFAEPPTKQTSIRLDDTNLAWPNGFGPDFLRGDQPDPNLLTRVSDKSTRRDFVCDSFYCLCPETGQPDQARIIIDCEGPELDARGLYAYLVSYRSTGSFHEANIERIYKDLWERTSPQGLEVRGRFHRRGGISINPVRGSTNFIRGLPERISERAMSDIPPNESLIGQK